MTLPRKSLISLDDTPYYHCVSRCVRRAYLCGFDQLTSKSYEHRRDWLEYKLLKTAEIFAINLCSYAVMSNHYHVVLHVRRDIADSWSDREIVERWHRLFSGFLLSKMFLAGEPLRPQQWLILSKRIKLWRSRLTSISWFMRIVNEFIARQANAEDQCSGRFWEGRFKSQALLDEQALLSCMAYVDLNPIRAKISSTPESSDFTSIKRRINLLQNGKTDDRLEKFVGTSSDTIGIPYNLIDYIDLVDWTGRIIRPDKRGAINSELPTILERLSLDSKNWRVLTTEFEQRFHGWVGTEQIVKRVCKNLGYKQSPDTRSHQALFG